MTEPQHFPALHSGSECVSWVLAHVSEFDWFERVRQPQNSIDPLTLRINLDGNESKTIPIEYVETHLEAVNCLKSRYDKKWLKYEESRRAKLLATAQDHGMDDELWHSFKVLIDQLPKRIMHYAEKHLATADMYLPRVGAGSAVEACYLYALELFVAGQPREFTRDRLKLFKLGRWPLCFCSNRFAVF